jgi:hypothetical protein
MTEAQRLNLDLIRLAGFNDFDGERVVEDLLAHRDLWDAVLLEQRGLRALFELPHDHWWGDTLHILPSADRPGAAQDLEALAHTWRADEVGWTHPDYFQVDRSVNRRVLTLWWD